MSIRNRL